MTTKQIKHLGGHVPTSRGLIDLMRNQSTHHHSMVGTSPCWGLLSTQPCQPEHHAPKAHHVAAANCGLVVRGAWLPPFYTRMCAHKALQWHRPTPMISAHDPISLQNKPIIFHVDKPISKSAIANRAMSLPSTPIFLYHKSAEKVPNVRIPNS